MITPLLQDEAFLEDVQLARADTAHFHVWWLGQSGYLIQIDGRHLLMDPYLSDSLSKKYPSGPKAHVRRSERVVAPESLDFIDVVTSSHSHTDHLDAETLSPLIRVNPKLELLIPEATRAKVVDRLGTPIELPRGLDAGQSKSLGGFTFHGIAAAHPQLDRDDWGRHPYLGYVVECGPWNIFHSGDTVLHPGLLQSLRPYRIDLALLPITSPSRDQSIPSNLSVYEAARLAREIRAGLVVPCHYQLFEFNSASPATFASACQALGQPFKILQQGQRLSLGSAQGI